MKYKRNFIAVIAGHLIEHYDVIISGFFASLVAPIFFPSASHELEQVFIFGTFASGFIMRPLGGIIFGHFGDKLGRRKPFVSSILFVTLTTLVIGILPSYEKIGITSSIIFILARLLQGLSIGGEYSGAIIYFFENMPKNKQGLAGSVICASGFLGGVIGILLGALCFLPGMPTWAWRIPFILGSILGALTYLQRVLISETTIFQLIEKKSLIVNYPILPIIRKNKWNLCCTIFIGGYDHILLNFSTIYLPNVLTRELNYPLYQVALYNSFLWLMWMIAILITGYASNYISQRVIMLCSSLILVASSIPLYILVISDKPTINAIVVLQVVVWFCGATYFAASSSFLPRLFSPQERYTGIAVGLNIGQAVLGSLSPLLISFLIKLTNSFSSIAVVLAVVGSIAFLVVFTATVRKEGLDIIELHSLKEEINYERPGKLEKSY